MEAMRERWTDDRLDCLNRRIDDGFDRVDERFKEVDRRFEEMGKGFARVDADMREIRSEISAMHKAMLQLGVGVIVTMIIGFLTVLTTTL